MSSVYLVAIFTSKNDLSWNNDTVQHYLLLLPHIRNVSQKAAHRTTHKERNIYDGDKELLTRKTMMKRSLKKFPFSLIHAQVFFWKKKKIKQEQRILMIEGGFHLERKIQIATVETK